MAPKTSFVWKFFKIVSDDKAECDVCKRILSYKGSSTSNLKRHLDSHPATSGNSKSPPHPHEADDEDDAQPSEDIQVDPPADANTKPVAKQTSLAGYFNRPMSIVQKKKIDILVLKMIVRDLQPFSVVDDPGFRELVATLSPTYELPSRTTLTRNYLASKFVDMEAAVKRTLDCVDYVSLTTDIWTSRTTQAYIAITAHYVTKNWTLGSVLLGCVSITGSHTGIHIRDEVLKVLNNI